MENLKKKRKVISADETERDRKRAVVPFRIVCDGSRAYEDDWFLYEPALFDEQLCLQLKDALKREHLFRQNKVKVCGNWYDAPRKEALLGRQAGVRYKYAGNSMLTEKWSEQVEQMCRTLSARYRVEFNACLANWYRDGHDCVGLHADDEDDMEVDVVATVSLGATRLFRVRDRASGDREVQVALLNGSVHVQKRGMQRVRKHEIPRQLTIHDDRISLTFRRLKQK